MSVNANGNRIYPTGFDLFVGMDVDKRSIVMTVVDRDKIIEKRKLPYDGEGIINYFSRRYEGDKIAFVYEAGPTGYGLHDKLVEGGCVCLIASPSNIPVVPGSMVKTNRIDSLKLAESLRAGQITGIHVPSEPYRRLRHLVQLRDTFVKQAAATKCRIKALLLLEGLPFPAAPIGGQWSRIVLDRLRTDKAYEKIRFKLDGLLRALEFAQGEVKITQQETRRFCKMETEIAESLGYLMSIPGIGKTIATEMLARIGDWRKIENVMSLGAFLGLTPREFSTGEDVNRGRITRSGNERLRNKLIEGSWAAIRQDGELLEFYWKVYHRQPRQMAAKKAIVAVARKLTCRIYRVLKDRRCYEVRVAVGEKQKARIKLEQKETNTPRELGGPDYEKKERQALGDASTTHRTRYALKS